jgi:C-terminal processing protease CtpA/Prc
VVHLVQSEYVDELNQEALALSLDAGIIESVDPEAAVLSGAQVEAYSRLIREAPAFGLVIDSRLGSAAVRHTVAGSPAAEVALAPWEVIEEVDGVNTRGRPLWELRLALAAKAREGAAVTLTVVDQHVDERRSVVLAARPWTPAGLTMSPVQDIPQDIPQDIQMIRIESLPAGSAAALEQVVTGRSAVILDLRRLGWGLDSEWQAVADLFLAEGAIATWRGRRAGEMTLPASPGALPTAGLMVLVGPETEGIGETLASALERAGATLVGAATAGHAPFMQMVAATDDVHLWMPVGLWLRADGTPINGNGVVPSEVVEEEAVEGKPDPVVARAVALLTEPVAKAA